MLRVLVTGQPSLMILNEPSLFTKRPPICVACTPKPVSGFCLEEVLIFFESAIAEKECKVHDMQMHRSVDFTLRKQKQNTFSTLHFHYIVYRIFLLAMAG